MLFKNKKDYFKKNKQFNICQHLIKKNGIKYFSIMIILTFSNPILKSRNKTKAYLIKR